MSETTASGPIGDTKRLAAKGAIRAIVLGRQAIVQAQAYDPITTDSSMPPYTVIGREIQTGVIDIEAEGTPEADEETQKLIDGLNWNPWAI